MFSSPIIKNNGNNIFFKKNLATLKKTNLSIREYRNSVFAITKAYDNKEITIAEFEYLADAVDNAREKLKKHFVLEPNNVYIRNLGIEFAIKFLCTAANFAVWPNLLHTIDDIPKYNFCPNNPNSSFSIETCQNHINELLKIDFISLLSGGAIFGLSAQTYIAFYKVLFLVFKDNSHHPEDMNKCNAFTWYTDASTSVVPPLAEVMKLNALPLDKLKSTLKYTAYLAWQYKEVPFILISPALPIALWQQHGFQLDVAQCIANENLDFECLHDSFYQKHLFQFPYGWSDGFAISFSSFFFLKLLYDLIAGMCRKAFTAANENCLFSSKFNDSNRVIELEENASLSDDDEVNLKPTSRLTSGS